MISWAHILRQRYEMLNSLNDESFLSLENDETNPD